MLDTLFLVPACGEGMRVRDRGRKPFIRLADGSNVFDRVIAQATEDMDVHVALRTETSHALRMPRDGTVHFLRSSFGQANTIYQMLQRIETASYEWVLISNCDNAIGDDDIVSMMALVEKERAATGVATGINGVIATTRSMDEKLFSFCHVYGGKDNVVVRRITEKTEWSPHAICGVYLLRTTALVRLIEDTDVHLSQTLGRMRDLVVFDVRKYEGWNTTQQIEEWERENVGLPLYRFGSTSRD